MGVSSRRESPFTARRRLLATCGSRKILLILLRTIHSTCNGIVFEQCPGMIVWTGSWTIANAAEGEVPGEVRSGVILFLELHGWDSYAGQDCSYTQ
jgi:hypothetical protein